MIFFTMIMVTFGTRVAKSTINIYDVTIDCCAETITTSSVVWTLTFTEINLIFCSFEELLGFCKDNTLTHIKCGIKAKRHGLSVFLN